MKKATVEPAPVLLADMIDRLKKGSAVVPKLIKEEEALREKASTWQENVDQKDKKDSPERKSARAKGEKKAAEWKHVMCDVVANLDRLDICLMKFGPAAESLRHELKHLCFREPITNRAGYAWGPLHFSPDSSRVAAGLVKLQQILEAVPTITGGPIGAGQKPSAKKELTDAEALVCKLIGRENIKTMTNPEIRRRFQGPEKRVKMKWGSLRPMLNRIRKIEGLPLSKDLSKKK